MFPVNEWVISKFERRVEGELLTLPQWSTRLSSSWVVPLVDGMGDALDASIVKKRATMNDTRLNIVIVVGGGAVADQGTRRRGCVSGGGGRALGN